MANDVVLSAALRSNLLSLQGTQKSIDSTQLRLATGKKVNSALDNPQSFFASAALTNRANDLTRLLDGIGQSIQVIKAADNGVTALTKLVEQADAITKQAQDALAQGEAEAKVTGNVDLRNVDDVTTDLVGVTAGDTIQIDIADPEDSTNTTSQTITLAANETIESVVTDINNIRDSNGDKVIEAKLDAGGNLQIRSTNGGDLSIDFVSGGDTDAENLALATAFGFSDLAQVVQDGNGNNNVSLVQVASATLDSTALVDANGDPVTRSTLLNAATVDGTANTFFENLGAGSQLTIAINGGAQSATIALVDGNNTSITVQGLIDGINTDPLLEGKIEASFDEATGVFSIEATDGTVQSIEIAADTADAYLGFTTLVGAANPAEESTRFGSAAAELADLEGEFNNIRSQIDELVKDTGYRGTNLLNGDDLTTTFNEYRTSSLQTEGVTYNSDGLGLNEADFARKATVETALDEVRSALESVRAFGSTLANDLAIIQTRQDFTQNLVNTLTEGSDKLVNADQNEEGAKLLALQTRQSLGVTSLSLASQSQQSILRLF